MAYLGVRRSAKDTSSLQFEKCSLAKIQTLILKTMWFLMTSRTALTPALQPESSGSLSSTRGSLDHQSLNKLFRSIEKASPRCCCAGTPCQPRRGHADELKGVRASPDHIGELKSNRLRSPTP